MIPRGHKFAILAVSNLESSLPQGSKPLRVSSACFVSRIPPAELDAGWTKWVGSLFADSFRSATFFIACHAPSKNPGIVDAQSRRLERLMRLIWLGAMLAGGVPTQEGTRWASGEYPSSGDPNVRGLSTGPECWSSSILPHYRRAVDVRCLKRGVSIANGLAKLAGKRACFRIQKGLRMLIRGMHEEFIDDRVHAYVRALDGVLKLPKGDSQGAFASRASNAFLTSDAGNEPTLKEAYKLRNAVEHLKPIEVEIDGPRTKQAKLRRATLRAIQIETLAFSAYRQLAESANLRSRLKDDAHIDAFWAQDAVTIARAWPEKIPLRDCKNRKPTVRAVLRRRTAQMRSRRS